MIEMVVRSTHLLRDKNYFDGTIQACIDTLNRNKDEIYNLLLDKTREVTITFNFRPNEIVNMDINWNKAIYNSIENKNIEVKGEK